MLLPALTHNPPNTSPSSSPPVAPLCNFPFLLITPCPHPPLCPSRQDPFTLSSTPHVFFAGNQPAFATRTLPTPGGGSVRLVAVPSFAATGTLVLLNVRTLECHPVTFGAGGAGNGVEKGGERGVSGKGGEGGQAAMDVDAAGDQ